MIAKNIDKINVKTKDEKILLFKSSENSNCGDINPMCKLVDNLEANDPKIFPLIPIAPGIRTNKPGNVSKKKVILPNIIPAIKSPTAQIKRATNPSFITLLCSLKNSYNLRVDSELRIFFCCFFTHITTHNHFNHSSSSSNSSGISSNEQVPEASFSNNSAPSSVPFKINTSLGKIMVFLSGP